MIPQTPPIFVPTFNRVGKTTLFNYIPKGAEKYFHLVCTESEKHKQNMIIIPDKVEGNIGVKRQWIQDYAIRQGYKYYFTCDDSKHLRTRDLENGGFRDLTLQEFEKSLKLLQRDVISGCGFSAYSKRAFNHVIKPRHKLGATGNFICWNAELINKHSIRFSDSPTLEDVHVILSLCEFGYPFYSYGMFVCDSCNVIGRKKGGNRTNKESVETFEESLRYFHQLHPDSTKLKNLEEQKLYMGRPSKVQLQIRRATAVKRAIKDAKINRGNSSCR